MNPGITEIENIMNSIYEKYAETLRLTIVRLLGWRNPAYANDILQDTLLRVWKKIHLYDPSKGELGPWMKRIARNITIEFIAAESRKIRHTVQLQDISFQSILPDESGYPEIDVSFFLSRLNEYELQLMRLKYYIGLTQAEIAVSMDRPLGSIKREDASIHQKLRRCFCWEAGNTGPTEQRTTLHTRTANRSYRGRKAVSWKYYTRTIST